MQVASSEMRGVALAWKEAKPMTTQKFLNKQVFVLMCKLVQIAVLLGTHNYTESPTANLKPSTLTPALTMVATVNDAEPPASSSYNRGAFTAFTSG